MRHVIDIKEERIPEEQIWLSGRKDYEEQGVKAASSHLLVGQSPTGEFEHFCIRTIQRYLRGKETELWVLLITNVQDNRTESCIITTHTAKTVRRYVSEKPEACGSSLQEQEMLRLAMRECLAPAGREQVVRQLIARQISVSTMESCTSGLVASGITDTEGASAILKGAFITYSNEAKVLQGVPAGVIGQYGVYSFEVAAAMAAACRNAYQAELGIGVTGTTGNTDPNNPDSTAGEIYYALQWRDGHCLCRLNLDVTGMTRHEIKEKIVEEIMRSLSLLPALELYDAGSQKGGRERKQTRIVTVDK